MPEAFTGAGSWEEWLHHFECVVDVNKWETNAKKLKWLKVRLTGRALKAFRQLPEASQRDYKDAKKALTKRFEPESRREYYIAELQTRRRKKGEIGLRTGRSSNGSRKRCTPTLTRMREQFALTRILASIVNPQVAFSVRQWRPNTVDAVVTVAMEMESYLGPTGGHVGHVNAARSDEQGQDDSLEVMTVARSQDASIMAMLQKIFERLDKLESKVESVVEKKTRSAEAVVCWKYREQGHMARDCPKVQNPQQSAGGAVNTVVRGCSICHGC